MPRSARSEWSRASSALKRIRSTDILGASLLGRLPALRVRTPTQDWLARRRGFIEAAARSEDRSRQEPGNPARPRGCDECLDDRDELVERGLALALGPLDQPR